MPNETTQLPEPLTTAELDLGGYPSIMLDTERLLQSDTWAIATGDEAKAAVTLWCRAWRQTPIGSLPNDPSVLARLVGTTPAKWKKMAVVSMRGFILCSDNRWYHPILCDDAKRLWDTRVKNRDRTKAAIDARLGRTRNVQRDVACNDERNIECEGQRNVSPSSTTTTKDPSPNPLPHGGREMAGEKTGAGGDPVDDPIVADTLAELRACGVGPRKAEEIAANCGLHWVQIAHVFRQIATSPGVKNPAGVLVSRMEDGGTEGVPSITPEVVAACRDRAAYDGVPVRAFNALCIELSNGLRVPASTLDARKLRRIA